MQIHKESYTTCLADEEKPHVLPLLRNRSPFPKHASLGMV